MSVGPITRSLPVVLRQQLAQEGQVRLLIGRVAAIPDNRHVTVTIEGVNVVVPRLGNYLPQVGETTYCLATDTVVIALGTISAIPPPSVANADTLDGLDSADFWKKTDSVLTHALGGANRNSWWSPFDMATNSFGDIGFTHPLGAVPSCQMVTEANRSEAEVISMDADASWVNVHCVGASVRAVGWVLLIR